MDLLTVTQAIEKIKSAEAGSTFTIGLYKNASEDKDYSILLDILKCNPEDIILDGPYKVYSTLSKELIAPAQPATGWISADVWRYYREHPAETFDSFPVINGAAIWPDTFNSIEEYVAAINATPKTSVTAVYDSEENKILLTANEPGYASNYITLEVLYNDNWPESYGLKCSEEGTLTGGKDEEYGLKEYTKAVHVWIKNTDVEYNPENEEEKDTLDACIKMTVRPGYKNYPLTLDFNQRWSWDEYSEKEVSTVIDWGDGNVEEFYTLDTIQHTYEQAGEYEIIMYNIHWCGWEGENVPEPEAMPVTEINFIKPQIVTRPNNSLRSLEILKKVSGKIYTSHSHRSASGHNYMFLYDAELEDLSELTIHFGPGPDGKGITTLNSMFWGCPKVTAEVLDKLTVEHFDKKLITSSEYLFNGANVGSINNKLLGKNLINGKYMYSHCSSLQHLDGGILDNLVSGEHMFENTSIKSCDSTFGLPSLINGDCMFFGTELPFKVIKQIYHSLTPAPEDADYGNGSNNEPENYCITFGYDVNERDIESRLAKLFNIDTDKWHSGLPFWIHGQYDNSNDKKWYISFTNKNNIN
jgi:hypothetical protein